MSLAIVTLKRGEGRTIRAGGMWIFDNEIETILGNYENGDIVIVHSNKLTMNLSKCVCVKRGNIVRM